MTPAVVLQVLRGVDGVYGSFWVAGSGQIIARDVSLVVSSTGIADAGVSLARLWQRLAHLEPEELCLTFSAHRLFLVCLPDSTLCVFAAPRADLAELRAASRFIRPWLEAHGRAHESPELRA